MEPCVRDSRFCFLQTLFNSNVRTGHYKEYLTYLFSWFGKTKFYYLWTVILYFLGSWTVPETPPVWPSLLVKTVFSQKIFFFKLNLKCIANTSNAFPCNYFVQYKLQGSYSSWKPLNLRSLISRPWKYLKVVVFIPIALSLITLPHAHWATSAQCISGLQVFSSFHCLEASVCILGFSLMPRCQASVIQRKHLARFEVNCL